MHPASRILTYLLAALVIPGLPFFMLPILLLVPLVSAVWLRQSPWRLVWRTRWLILVLLLGYAYSLPGMPVFTGLGEWSPSLSGLTRGAHQALRLVILLLWLDLLVLRLPAEQLMAGLHELLRPLARLGVDTLRISLRLGLTLRAIETLERGRGNLVQLIQAPTGNDLPDRITLLRVPFRPRDVLPPVVVIGVALATWFSV